MKKTSKTSDESQCPKCGQDPCVCEIPMGNGSKGLDGSSMCPECNEPMEDGKCMKDGCGKKPKVKMDRVDRVDYWGDLNTSATSTEPLKPNASGALVGKAAISCVGVFRYLMPDGTIRNEFRPPEEVFRKESLESMELLPLTNTHPAEKVTPDNYKTHAVGSLGEEISHDAYNVYAELAIQEAQAIQDAQGGRTGLSCGYSVSVVEEGEVSYPIMGWNEDYSQRIEVARTTYQVPGNWGGIPYDAIQTNIVGNHVALVDVPRGGDALHVRFDSAEPMGVRVQHVDGNPAVGTQKPNSAQEENRMKTIHLDGEVKYEVPEPVAAHVDSLSAKLKDAEAVKADAEAKLQAANAALEAVKKDSDDLRASMPAKVQEAVTARLALVQKADGFGVKVAHEDSEDSIKGAIVKAAMPTVNLDCMDSVHLDAHYSAACSLLDARGPVDSVAAQRQDAFQGVPKAKESEKQDSVEARLAASWKTAQ